jgi:hypothetical protein
VEFEMKLLRDNSLTIVLLAATLATIVGMILTGLSVYNDELADHRTELISLPQYMASGHLPVRPISYSSNGRATTSWASGTSGTPAMLPNLPTW